MNRRAGNPKSGRPQVRLRTADRAEGQGARRPLTSRTGPADRPRSRQPATRARNQSPSWIGPASRSHQPTPARPARSRRMIGGQPAKRSQPAIREMPNLDNAKPGCKAASQAASQDGGPTGSGPDGFGPIASHLAATTVRSGAGGGSSGPEDCRASKLRQHLRPHRNHSDKQRERGQRGGFFNEHSQHLRLP